MRHTPIPNPSPKGEGESFRECLDGRFSNGYHARGQVPLPLVGRG